MGSTPAETPTRLIVVGNDEQGRSTVVRDAPVTARVDRPKGSFAEELWRQDSLPARSTDDGTQIESVSKYPPEGGLSVRRLSLPPTGEGPNTLDMDALVAEFGAENLTDPADGPVLHRHAKAMQVIHVLSGSCYFLLGTGEVLLEPGTCIVLRGSMHDWRNPFDEPCIILATIMSMEL